MKQKKTNREQNIERVSQKSSQRQNLTFSQTSLASSQAIRPHSTNQATLETTQRVTFPQNQINTENSEDENQTQT
ncbi:unnamed protein product, partial [Brachionus calyciflorus]